MTARKFDGLSRIFRKVQITIYFLTESSVDFDKIELILGSKGFRSDATHFMSFEACAKKEVGK